MTPARFFLDSRATSVASAQRVLDGKRTTKKKLASLVKIAAGLTGAGLVTYAAYLARSSKFAKLAQTAANATANARARSINGVPTTQGLLSKTRKMFGLAAGAAGLLGAATASYFRKNNKKNNKNNNVVPARRNARLPPMM